jgi:Leucine-rich repeat (LRR) protein
MPGEKPDKTTKRTFADMASEASIGTLLSDRALNDTDNAEGFNMPFIMGPIFDVIRNKETVNPLTVGIYGGWGTGKTSAMRWLHEIIKESNKLEKPEPKVIPVWFYPWKYQSKDDVWRGIIAEVILATLDKTTLMEAGIADLLAADGQEKIKNAIKKFGPTLGNAFIEACLSLDPENKSYFSKITKICRDVKKNLHPESRFLNAFETELKTWIKKFLGNERIVVFIDDLDRCLPEVTLQVLEALKLYLNIEKLVFVVGVDNHVVEQIVIKHYDTQGVDKEKASQYLAKMFQIEVNVGPTEQEIDTYFKETVGNLSVWESVKDDYKKVLSKAIIGIADRNPRDIKRIANAALLGGMGAQWNQTNDENAFAIGAMIRLVQQEIPSNLKKTIGDTQGDLFLHEVSNLIIAGKREEIETAILEKQIVENSATPSEKRVDLSKIPELNISDWRPFYPIFDLPKPKASRILDLLVIPYPEKSGTFAQPTIIDESDPVLAALKENPNPRQLFLSSNKVTDLSLSYLSRLTNLEDLDVSFSQITDQGLSKLLELQSLKSLVLQNTQITNLGLRPLREFSRLESISLDMTKITDFGLSSLVGLTSLKSLLAAYTNISDNALRYIGQAPQLQVLSLHDTKITDVGLKHLTSLTRLVHLYLLNTQVTDVGCKELEAAIPGLMIFH